MESWHLYLWGINHMATSKRIMSYGFMSARMFARDSCSSEPFIIAFFVPSLYRSSHPGRHVVWHVHFFAPFGCKLQGFVTRVTYMEDKRFHSGLLTTCLKVFALTSFFVNVCTLHVRCALRHHLSVPAESHVSAIVVFPRYFAPAPAACSFPDSPPYVPIHVNAAGTFCSRYVLRCHRSNPSHAAGFAADSPTFGDHVISPDANYPTSAALCIPVGRTSSTSRDWLTFGRQAYPNRPSARRNCDAISHVSKMKCCPSCSLIDCFWFHHTTWNN